MFADHTTAFIGITSLRVIDTGISCPFFLMSFIEAAKHLREPVLTLPWHHGNSKKAD